MNDMIPEAFQEFIYIALILVVIVVVVYITLKLIKIYQNVRATKRKENLLKKLHKEVVFPETHEEFATYIAEFLMKNDYTDVKINKKFDLVADKDSLDFFIHCKVSGDLIDEALLNEVNKTKEQLDKIGSMIVTNHSFISTERALAKKHRVTLWDKDDIYEILFNEMVSEEFRKKHDRKKPVKMEWG